MKQHPLRRWTAGIVCAALSCAAQAQAYPTKAVRLVVPFSPDVVLWGGYVTPVTRKVELRPG